jgi:hypothetical protein
VVSQLPSKGFIVVSLADIYGIMVMVTCVTGAVQSLSFVEPHKQDRPDSPNKPEEPVARPALRAVRVRAVRGKG